MSNVSEMLSERFTSAYRELLVRDLRDELLAIPRVPMSPADIAYLISNASRLALASDTDSPVAGEQCQLAYDIAFRVPRFANGTSGIVVPLCENILSRLGNFPARELLRKRSVHIAKIHDPYLDLETAVREEENKLEDTPEGVILTDFQIRLLTALRGSQSVSVSAPTSAGKSFTLEMELLHRLRHSSSYTAVFLVPTRALIRQVSVDLMDLFRANDVECSVLSSISLPDKEEDAPRRIIFVLTQERFATLLSEVPREFPLDAIIIDEAQEICKDRRGITLERVIRLALRRTPTLQLFFSSPLRSNPAYLLSLFARDNSDAVAFVEYQRPVTQNMILVKPVKGKPRSIILELKTDFGMIEIGNRDIPFDLRGRYLAALAKYLTGSEDVSIVYRNSPSEADKTAAEISELCEIADDEELSDFAEFLQQEIHRHYRLADMVRRGVAFHYGNIPQIVRSRIEELAKQRKLKFVCCTSTLLQGVNLPAKNIFLENPKTGRGEAGKILPGDFWNLVGRAGRLNHEFSGNVFCIFGKKWDSDPLTGDRLMPIESAFQVALLERSKELANWATKPAESAESSEAWAEQAFANIYADFVTTKQRVGDSSPDLAVRSALERVDLASEAAFTKKTLPNEIYANNMYVHPNRLEELAERFRSAGSLTPFCPVLPLADGAYQNLLDIFWVIEEVFIKSNSQRHKYFTFLAFNWMRGESIRELVRARLEWKGVKDDAKLVNEEIRDLFREIEDDLRYKYVKYTNIYIQVLRAVLQQNGEAKKSEGLLPLHMFLEFGASQKVLISLMSAGLSRTSALLLQSSVRLSSDSTVADCRRYLNSVNLNRIEIPAICKAEIRRLMGNAH